MRYADDMVFCFENEETAKQFYEDLVERLNRFNLEISAEKTKIIPFGKRALENKTSKTFGFLGMTHYMDRSRNGSARVKRKTSKKKYKASINKCKEWIKQHRNMPIKQMWKKMFVKLKGYYRHYWNNRQLGCNSQIRARNRKAAVQMAKQEKSTQKFYMG